MPYTAGNVTPGGRLPEDFRKKHSLSEAAHWAYDQSPEDKPVSRAASRPALRRETLPTVKSVPRGMLGYGEGHGARLRAEKRNWEREAAYTLAGASMAETERRQVGETRRAEIAAAGKTDAAGRLSATNQAQIRKQQLEAFDIKTESLFSPYMEYGPEGETMLPPQLRNIYNVGRAMSLDDPEGAQKYVKEEVAAFKKSAGQEARAKPLEDLSPEQLSAYEQSLTGGGRADVAISPGVKSEAVVPPWGDPRASKRFGLSLRAARHAAEYEKEHPTPIIGAGVLGRFKEAWGRRQESPYVTLGR